MKGICYIVGAGKMCSLPSVTDDDLVIAADGGYSRLKSEGIRCDLLIGDMDSIESVPTDIELLRHPVEKDETDSFLAYLEGARRGYTNFEIYGGVGGRDDHTFANYSLLIYAIERGHRIKLIGEQFDIFAIKNEKIKLRGKVGETVSVFAFGNDAIGVTLIGLKYEARGITLTPSFPLGVSNSFTENEAEIEVNDGTLLIMSERC